MQRCRIEFRSRGNPQISEELLHSIVRNRNQGRGLANVGSQHLRQAASKPVKRRIPPGVTERKNGERNTGPRGLRGDSWGENFSPEYETRRNEQNQRESRRNPPGRQFLHRTKSWQPQREAAGASATLRLQIRG